MLGLVCHIGVSSVAGNRLRSSRRLDYQSALVLLVPCTNLIFFSFLDILAQPLPHGASFSNYVVKLVRTNARE